MKHQSLKRCPIGIQTFEKVINKDYLYIDKTEYIVGRLAHRKIAPVIGFVLNSVEERFAISNIYDIN